MIAAKSSAVAAKGRKPRTVEGSTGWHTVYLGANKRSLGDRPEPEPGTLFPVAHLLEMDGGGVLEPHFHEVNQFQVVVGGDGHFGKTPVCDISIYFTGIGTVYGPTCAGPKGLTLLTLRNNYDMGARHMPKYRERLKELGRKPRHRMIGPVSPLSADELAARSDVKQIQVLEAEEDGLAIWDYRIPPGGSITGPDPAMGGGQYWVVLGGDHAHQGETQPPLSCLFVSSEEAPVTLTAGLGDSNFWRCNIQNRLSGPSLGYAVR